MNKNISLSILAVFLCLIGVKAQDNVIDEVIAVVGADAILKSDVEEMFYRMQAEGYDYEGNLKCKLMEDMLIQKLLLNQSKLDSIEVSESVVMQQVEQRINYFISQIGSREKMEEYFNKNTFDLKEDLRTVVREQMLTEQMKSKITEGITTTPAEVRYFYKTTAKDSIPTIPAEFEIQQIVIEPKIEQEEIDRIKTQLRDYQTKANNGDDFSVFCLLYSEDVNSARRGGELGFMGKGMLVPEFADVAFNLRDPNKVSRIVETEYGYHIIQLIERRGSKVNCRHLLLKPKISNNAREEAFAALDSIATIIKDGTLTFEASALYYSSDKDTRSNGGLLANPSTGSSKFEISDPNLPPDIAKVAQNMQTNDISEPFSYINQNGQEVIAMIKIKSKTDAHTANLKDDYQRLKESFLVEKKQTRLEEWIKEKQRDTYISLDEDWKDCEFEYSGW